MPDSYDLLARSIERVVRRDLPPPATRQRIAAYTDRIIMEESRGGELRLAWLRVLLVAPFFVLALDAAVRHEPDTPFASSAAAAAVATALTAGWLAMSAGLVIALRRGWYRRWVPHFMPIISAAMIVACFLVPMLVAGRRGRAASPEAIASLTVLCAYLSIAGALRLSRTSVQLGTILSVGVFVISAAAAQLSILTTIAITISLVAIGFLSASVTKLIRRLVTEEVAKATLTQAYNDATREIDAREQVLKIVSHDLRNPLHTLDIGASLLLDVEMPRDAQQEHLRRIKRAGERMNRLVRDLLEVAKLEAGRVAITPRELEVLPLLREAHDMLAPTAAAASLQLDLDVADDLPTVTADSGRVLQVLSNLVGNAVKFTPPGGRITISARPSPGGVHFAVSDTGSGIPPEQLEQIFGRFWQANAADRRGIGLGLSIAKGIMDAHGARLWVESRVGEGTTFHFILSCILPEVTSITSMERRRTSEMEVQV